MLLENSNDLKMNVKFSKEQVFEEIGFKTRKFTLQELFPTKEEIYERLNGAITSFSFSLTNRHKHYADTLLLQVRIEN